MTRNRKRHIEYIPENMEKLFEHRKGIRRGNPNRRIIAKGSDEHFEYFLHATKGFRRYKK